MPENSASATHDALDDRTAALAGAVLEIGRHVGADRLSAPRVFALVDTAALLRSQPAFAALLDEADRAAAEGDPHHLTPIELEAPAPGTDPAAAVAESAWPDLAAGAAIACDLAKVRAAEGTDEQARRHLGTGAVRAVVAARTDGSTWCAVRGDGRREQALGPRLVPELADALTSSLSGSVSSDG